AGSWSWKRGCRTTSSASSRRSPTRRVSASRSQATTWSRRTRTSSRNSAFAARLGVEIQGKDLFSPHGEYIPHLVIGGLRRFLTSAGLKSQSTGAIEDRDQALTAHREKGGTVRLARVAKRPPSFCTGCPERPVFSALKILRTREPAIGDTHVAADIGCSTFSTQRSGEPRVRKA